MTKCEQIYVSNVDYSLISSFDISLVSSASNLVFIVEEALSSSAGKVMLIITELVCFLVVLDLASFLGVHAVMSTLLIGSIELDDGSLMMYRIAEKFQGGKFS